MPYANINLTAVLIAMLITALVVLFVALRYDEARQRRIELARKRELALTTSRKTPDTHDH